MRVLTPTLVLGCLAAGTSAIPQQVRISPTGMCDNESIICPADEYCADSYCRKLCVPGGPSPCPGGELCAYIGFLGPHDTQRGCYTYRECCEKGSIDGLFVPGLGACTWPIPIAHDDLTGETTYGEAPWPCDHYSLQYQPF